MMATLTINGKRYTIAPRSYDPSITDLTGPGIVAGIAYHTANVPTDRTELREWVAAEIAAYRIRHREAGEAARKAAGLEFPDESPERDPREDAEDVSRDAWVESMAGGNLPAFFDDSGYASDNA